MKTLQNVLDEHTDAAELFNLENGRIRCIACAHRCLLKEGQRGICKVRYVNNEKLRIPWGYVGALQLDPIEKKPFFHALPGTTAFSFGMLGCDYHCGYCQNWFTSQALRDENSTPQIQEIDAEDLVQEALRLGSKTLVSTYNEPLITSEWARHIFIEAKRAGLKTAYVSNGNATREVLEYIRPYTDFYKIDLKGFQPKSYAGLGGNLQAVLDSIKLVYKMGFWMEIVTLVVPGFNDSEKELRDIAEFLSLISPDIPWHVTSFHPDYLMADRPNTQPSILLKAAEIGKKAGLRYIYPGNLPGQVGNGENTYCHSCGALLIERFGFQVRGNYINENQCLKCKAQIPGVWE